MTYKEQILIHVADYLRHVKWAFNAQGGVRLVCPYCKDKAKTAQLIPNNYKMVCKNPDCPSKGKKFSLISFVRKTEEDKKEWGIEKVLHYIKESLKLNINSPIDRENGNKLFDFYVENGFSLVPIVRGGKKPIREAKNWTNETHKNKIEWLEWQDMGLNIGVRTGIESNLTIIDIDTLTGLEQQELLKAYKKHKTKKIKEIESKIIIPSSIKKVMGDTLIQKSFKGYHLLYKYEKDLPKTNIEIEGIHIDIENDGGQVVTSPSRVDRFLEERDLETKKIIDRELILTSKRYFINGNKIIAIPEDLKKLIKEHTDKNIRKKNPDTQDNYIDNETYKRPLITEGEGRNELFLRLGGMYRKFLSKDKTKQALRVLDKVICEPELGDELYGTVFKSIDRYNYFDEEQMSKEILDYIKEIKEVDQDSIERAMVGNRPKGEEKSKLDKCLAHLIEEDLIQKRGRFYKAVKRLTLKTSLIKRYKPVDFKVPYFDDIMYFAYGDVILIGAKPGTGKTFISMNIIKQLVDQGKKPIYISLEAGSRFQKIAIDLKLKEGDFVYAEECDDPTQVELENDSITIIDWLMPSHYKFTDKIIGHFNKQLNKHGGFLFLFVQLRKSNGDWYAKDLIEFFPAFATKYFYDDEDDGSSGYFHIEKVRASRTKNRKRKDVSCRFNWDTKILSRVSDNISKDKKEKEIELKEGD